MRIFITQIFFLIYVVSFGQELTTIKVSVPNATDEVFIVGNQKSLGNWQPDKIRMSKVSEYEREISLPLSFPAEFKFTRGTWQSEAIITKISGDANIVLKEKPAGELYYKIQGWTDQIDEFSTFSDFKISEINSVFLNQKRKLYISLPENYNENIDYPVVYVTDANDLDIFEIVVQTIRQQSNFSNFPKCIVVGIFINAPERNKELDIHYGENGKKFKEYIFKEVVHFIDKNYSASSFRALYGHSDGAEYNHYLMFEKDNPFDAFINISENLIDLQRGRQKSAEKMYIDFLKNNTKPIKYFVASGLYDDPNRYPSGKVIEKIFDKQQPESVDFKHKIYKSWHVDLIGYSVLDAFQHVFSGYQDYGLFEKGVKSKSFDYKKTKEQYIQQNEKYIKPYVESAESSSIVGEIIRQTQNPKLLEQYLDCEDPNKEIFSLYSRAILFYEINDLVASLSYFEQMVTDNDLVSVRQLVNSKGVLYLEIYEKTKKLHLARKNLAILKEKNPDMKEGLIAVSQYLE